jgi:hypothetical protein
LQALQKLDDSRAWKLYGGLVKKQTRRSHVAFERLSFLAGCGLLRVFWKTRPPALHFSWEGITHFEDFADGKISYTELCQQVHTAPMRDGSAWLALWLKSDKLLERDYRRILWDIFYQAEDRAQPCFQDTFVQATARSLYRSAGFFQLTALRTALADAGCTSRETLEHCDQDQHVKGCWLVDLILGLDLAPPGGL